MKHANTLFISIFLIFSFYLTSCSTNEVSDIDGNVYKAVKIGDQVWMAENLKVTKYRNGDPVPNVTSNNSWIKLKTGAYCNYNNNSENGDIYGRLYNWYAVNDPRGLAPEGWHIPTDDELDELIDFIGEKNAHELKSTTGWESNNDTNKSGFTALAGGFRWRDGTFKALGQVGSWWSKDDNDNYTESLGLSSIYTDIGFIESQKEFGYSVRCIKD